MSRRKPRRAIRTNEKGQEPGESALRAELEVRLDQLRATIEAKRRAGWTLVSCPTPQADQPS